MSKDGIREWEDVAAEDRVAGCPGYVSQKVSLHQIFFFFQIFFWFHFLTSGLILDSQIHVMLQENGKEEMHPSRPRYKHTVRADWGLREEQQNRGNVENSSVSPLNSLSSKILPVI